MDLPNNYTAGPKRQKESGKIKEKMGGWRNEYKWKKLDAYGRRQGKVEKYGGVFYP